ncbi:hypothetical protein SEA_OTTAWA_101 [Arthrobacter phage Ottawa]|nr:hypothetical protein SEA_KHARCHO_101 [Arthrobacter phage Kharcho]WIC89333.1 hypothetical protein SEA_OTTAWA_101 [Arthrobacter phage Ottawa]
MAAIQKINHLKVERLFIKGVEVSPVEAPAELPGKATLAEVTAAYESLVDRLTEAGILTPSTDAPQSDEDTEA